MNICIVDDHLLVSQSIKRILDNMEPRANNTRIYKSAEEFLAEEFADWKPELVLVDITLPGMNGIDMITKSRETLSDAKYVILTSMVDLPLVEDLMRKGGISGYITKDASEDELLEGVQTVMRGTHYINRSLKDKLLEHLLSDEPINFNISAMEKKVLHKICSGSTPKEIAYETNLSIHTIQRYIKNLMRKFKVKRTTELVLFAVENGLYNPVTKNLSR